MSKYVYLPQTTSELPLLDQELIYADMPSMVYRSLHQSNIVNSLPRDTERKLKFFTSVNEGGCYPRFNPEDCCYNLNPDYDITPRMDFKNLIKIDFETQTDLRSLELKEKLKTFERVYVFWSGGIDSTLVLTAILKNWSMSELQSLTVVCNHNSIKEHSSFYHRFILNKLDTVSTDLFYSDKEKFDSKNIYVSTETADALIAYSEIKEFGSRYPGLFKKSYKKHTKEILEYFGNDYYAYHSYEQILSSLKKNSVEVDTIFDFLWWINFNWGFDLEVYYMLWTYSIWPEHIDTRSFLQNNIFDWFKTVEYQNWSVGAIGSSDKIRDTIESNKFVYKKYIFDFDKDLEYFLYKTKEPSTSLNKDIMHGKKVVAIDKDWTLYYR